MKRGQLQMQESIIVIFIVIVLFLIGFILFYRFTILDIENQIEKHETFEFRQLINVVPNMPEIKCSYMGVTDDCIDVMKLRAYSELDLGDFGSKLLVVKDLQRNQEWILYENEPNDYDSVLKISTPVSLYYSVEDVHTFGILMIEEYK